MSEAIQKQIKLYLIIGLALFVGTVLTVWVADLKVAIMTGIVIAVVIASIKSFLVAGYFMHLFHERKLIYQVLLLTAVFIVVMIGLFIFAFGDQQGAHHGIFNVPVKHVTPADAGHGAAAHDASAPAHHE
ncbi:MAG: cytochrome C oxidase subunit IV family protein [Verrucomicrobiota bacterium]